MGNCVLKQPLSVHCVPARTISGTLAVLLATHRYVEGSCTAVAVLCEHPLHPGVAICASEIGRMVHCSRDYFVPVYVVAVVGMHAYLVGAGTGLATATYGEISADRTGLFIPRRALP